MDTRPKSNMHKKINQFNTTFKVQGNHISTEAHNKKHPIINKTKYGSGTSLKNYPQNIGVNNNNQSYGHHFPHFTQFLSFPPKPQLWQIKAGIFVPPHHLPHLTQLSFLFPNPQLVHKCTETLSFGAHFPHLKQLSF